MVFVTPTWPTAEWVKAMQKVAPKLDVRSWPDVGNPQDIHYAAAWLPPANILKSFPNLRAIFSLGAGVDAILSDPTLPRHLPIVRVNDPDLTNRMSEYIVLHCLMHHRQQRRIDANQKALKWDGFVQHAAKDMTVGIMGLGALGQDAAQKLLMMGFKVVGWSRSKKQVAGVESFDTNGLDEFLARTDILVCLLPATAQTDGVLNRALFAKLSRQGPLGAPVLINAGRGRQQNEEDVLACLNDGTLLAATLDVFRQEPLPVEHPLWQHPKVNLTPHMAADSEPATICAYVARQINRNLTGQDFENIVDLNRGY